MKVEGGHVEGGADNHAGSRPENRAYVQAGVGAGIQVGRRVEHRVDRLGRLAQGRVMPGSGVRTFVFFGAALARRPEKCNAHRGYLERPDVLQRKVCLVFNYMRRAKVS